MKAILFDFDGTLADTQKAILVTLRNTLKKEKVFPPAESLLKPLIGLPLKEIFARAANNRNDSFLKQCVDIYRQDFEANCENNARLYPGVPSALETLRNRGYLLAIASSRGKASLLFLLELFGLKNFFSVIAGEEDVIHPKPAADLVEHILKKLNLAREEAMMVGDTIYDIEAGKAAGIKTCACIYGNQDLETLSQVHPDYILNSFPEILKIV